MFRKYKIVSLILVLIAIAIGLSLPVWAQHTVITWAGWEPAERLDLVKNYVIAPFEKDNPGVKVNIRHAPWDKFFDLALIWMASDTAPDCWTMHFVRFPDFVKAGAFQSLEPFIARDKEEVNLEDFYPAIRNAFTYEGKLYILAYDVGTYGCFVNLEMFKDAGVAFPNLNPNDTWTLKGEFLNKARLLTRDLNGDGKIDQWGTASVVGGLEQLCKYIWPNGGKVFNEEQTESLIDCPENVDALQFLADLHLKYKVAPSPTAQGMPLFETGKIAIRDEGPWWISAYRNRCTFDWDIVPLPMGSIGAPTIMPTGGTGFGVSATTKHPEEAWSLVKRFTSKYTMENVVGKMGWGLPARRSSGSSVIQPGLPPQNAWIYVEAMQNARPTPILLGREGEQILAGQLQLVFAGEKTAAEALKTVDEEWEKLLTKMGK